MKRYSAIVAGVFVILCLGFILGRFTGTHRAESKTTSRRVLYYVDPMHPAYRSDKPGIAPDCGMALEPVYEDETRAAKALPLNPGDVALSPDRQRMIGIAVEAAVKNSGTRTIRTTGRVIPDDNHLYRIQAGFDGWVESLKDTPPGTVVRREQVLATLYGPEIRSAALNYVGFMAGVERLRQGMAESEMKPLDDSKRVNEEQLRLLGMGEDEITRLGETHHASSSLNLVAPGDGIVLSRSVSPHQRFERGAELYRIANLGTVWIMADVHGTDGEFRAGMKVRISVPESGKTVEARVSETMPLFDETSRTLKVRLEAQNPGLLLRPDMFVDVEFESRAPEGLSIPSDAVLDSGLRKIVYLESSDGLFEPRSVQISGTYGDRVIVASGINEGDRVVVSGNFLLDSESRMRLPPQPSATSTPAEDPLLHPVANSSTQSKPSTRGLHGEARDPVCGMTLKSSNIYLQEIYQGKTFGFCSDKCRKQFLADPAKYSGDKAALASIAAPRAAHRHD